MALTTGRNLNSNGIRFAILMAVSIGAALTTYDAQAALLRVGQSLAPNQRLLSDGGRYFVVLQTDGNLVVYRDDGIAFWNSQTAGSGATVAVMQADGNFVLYTAAGQAVWSTRTWGRERAFGVDSAGRALIVRMDKMKKLDRARHTTVYGMTAAGAKIEWVASTFDGPHYLPRPKGKHCIGNPRACGGDLEKGIKDRPGIRIPFG